MLERFANLALHRTHVIGVVTPGKLLTVSVASLPVPSLLDELIEVKGCSRIVNYGLDKLRLKEAVRSGSRIRINAQILSVRFFGGGDARVTFKVKWEIEGCERPACLAEAVLIYYR